MKRSTRWVVPALAAGLMLVPACTSQTKETGSTAGSGSAHGTGLAATNVSAGSTVGITANEINVAFIGVDFGALKSTGLVPDLGNQEKQVDALVAEINSKGGVAGRKINLHFKLLNFLAGGADAIQAACIDATRDFKAAVVLLPPASPSVLASCTAVTNQTLTIDATGFDDTLTKKAQGRIFAPPGMSIDRQYRGWVDEMDQLGLLKGKKIGIIAGDQPAEFLGPIKAALVPELTHLGYKVTQSVTLPCSSGTTSCEQYDAGAQKLKDAGVDVVFMTLANTFGPPFVQAAANLGYHPKWLMEGNQATDTISGFFKSVKQDWNGAVGVSFAFASPSDITATARECNRIVAQRSGEKYAPGSDAFGFTSNVCTELRVLVDGAAKVDPAGLNQGELIKGMASLGTIPLTAGPDGTLTPTKHDGLDYMFLCDYRASVGKCVRRSTPPFRVAP